MGKQSRRKSALREASRLENKNSSGSADGAYSIGAKYLNQALDLGIRKIARAELILDTAGNVSLYWQDDQNQSVDTKYLRLVGKSDIQASEIYSDLKGQFREAATSLIEGEVEQAMTTRKLLEQSEREPSDMIEASVNLCWDKSNTLYVMFIDRKGKPVKIRELKASSVQEASKYYQVLESAMDKLSEAMVDTAFSGLVR